MAHMGLPTSTLRNPRRDAASGPMVLPQAMSLRFDGNGKNGNGKLPEGSTPGEPAMESA